ncbi:hypothetical protein HPP92_013670 [Vanilla planifolia]|uniref:Uncharacterized protein n=1 Tax=Vanilla planifolia TaxID=51239 RepID=A0A835UV10_VANPL|nr:hypothetical protein HPP92_013670 [Vanilla planifolia]
MRMKDAKQVTTKKRQFYPSGPCWRGSGKVTIIGPAWVGANLCRWRWLVVAGVGRRGRRSPGAWLSCELAWSGAGSHDWWWSMSRGGTWARVLARRSNPGLVRRRLRRRTAYCGNAA